MGKLNGFVRMQIFKLIRFHQSENVVFMSLGGGESYHSVCVLCLLCGLRIRASLESSRRVAVSDQSRPRHLRRVQAACAPTPPTGRTVHQHELQPS